MRESDTLTSGHYHYWQDINGDIVEVSTFCGDWCHRQFVRLRGVRYEGWNGCHEMTAPQWCDNCGSEF